MIYALAPMDGITDTATRQITKKIFEKYNKDDNIRLLLFTEFVSSDGFVHNFDGVKDHLIFEKNEKPIICQIFGNNVHKLLHTALEIEKNYDFDGIDLNIGCPAPKILRTGAGAALMFDKDNTLKIVKELSKSLNIPFSIKTRIGINEKDKSAQKDFIIKASYYCDMITIHARTLKQGLSGPVDLDYVLEVKQKANKNCKIIFNGGVNKDKLQDKIFIQKVKKLDGIMIGQATIGNPWVFVDYEPTWEKRKLIILEHLQLSIKYKGEKKGIIEFRKFIGNYIKGIKNASKFREKFMKVNSLSDFKKILEGIDV